MDIYLVMEITIIEDSVVLEDKIVFTCKSEEEANSRVIQLEKDRDDELMPNVKGYYYTAIKRTDQSRILSDILAGEVE
jgi:hypothetical protein